MSTLGFSQNPLVTRMMRRIGEEFRCTYSHCEDSEQGTDIDLVLTREMAPCHTDAFHLAQILQQNGYIYCDQKYIEKGFIHAKFTHQFDIWADTREPVEPGQNLTVDFSGEFFVDTDTLTLMNEREAENLLFERMLQAIHAFDSSIRDSREDLVRIFGPAHPWDWAHRSHIIANFLVAFIA